MQTPRRWRRVTVLATTFISDNDPESFAVATSTPLEHCCKTLPGGIQTNLESFFAQSQLSNTVTNITFSVERHSLHGLSFDPGRARICEDWKEAEVCDTWWHLADIDHTGCSNFSKARLWFCGAFLPAFLEDILVLHQLQGCEGVAKFVGVVVDDRRQQIKRCIQQCPELGSAANSGGSDSAESLYPLDEPREMDKADTL